MIIDDREKQIISTLIVSNIKFEIKRLAIGDFVILEKDSISLFERKTLKDFAASIKDGRYENIIKLANSRTENTKAFLIIEGNYNSKRIPLKVIEEEILKLSYQYSLPVFKMKSAVETVAMLNKIINFENPIKMNEELTVLRQMWSVFNGFTIANSDFMIKNFSIYSILCGDIKWNTFVNQYGKKLSSRSIKSLESISKDSEIKLLSKIPSLSKTFADKILASRSLRELCDLDDNILINIVGIKKAEMIRYYFFLKFELF